MSAPECQGLHEGLRKGQHKELHKRSAGFSLVEIAIVLVVLGVLAQAALRPLSALDASRKERQLIQELDMIRDALLAHLVSYGSLPCPLSGPEPEFGSGSGFGSGSWSGSGSGSGSRQHSSSETCTLRGQVSAERLALDVATDDAGAALDPWGRPYVYTRSSADSESFGEPGIQDWSAIDELSAVGIEHLRGTLTICRQARDPCAASAVSASDLVFVVLSLGADPSARDLQRLNAQATGDVFTLAPDSMVDGHRFDDALVWASRSEAVWWLLRAHRLP